PQAGSPIGDPGPLAVLTRRDRALPRAVLTRSLINPRFAAKTIAAVSFTSSEGSKANLLPCKALAATFIPIDESPGDDVYSGTAYSCEAASKDLFFKPSLRSRSSTYLPAR